jgi:hypothetical protein
MSDVIECPLCGKSPSRKITLPDGTVIPEVRQMSRHHYRGYQSKDTWLICQSCNVKLGDRHDGSLTIEEAREFIAHWTYEDRWPRRGYASECDDPLGVIPGVVTVERKEHPARLSEVYHSPV